MQDAEFVLDLCQMFHCTPSALDEEDAGLVRLVSIVARGRRESQGAPE